MSIWFDPPQAPVYVFVIDVSHDAVASGMLATAVHGIKSALDGIALSTRAQIAVITFDTSVHFYNLRETLAQPQMLVVSDIDDLFLPIPEYLLVNIVDSRHVIDALLDSLPSMHSGAIVTESALGSALSAAYSVMAHIGGKICLFQSMLASLGVGKLKARENPRLIGTDKEHTLLQAAEGWYKTKALEFSRHQISVEVFLCPHRYCDAATLGLLPRLTGGQMHYYPRFNGQVDGPRMSGDIQHSLKRTVAWEAVMRIRASSGVRVTNFYGNFFIRGNDLLALPNCDEDATFGVLFGHEQNMIATSTAVVQAALLYTSTEGERRIRVMTTALPVTTQSGDIIDHVDQDAFCNLVAKVAASRVTSNGFDDARRYIQGTCVNILRANSHRSTGGYWHGYRRHAPPCGLSPTTAAISTEQYSPESC